MTRDDRPDDGSHDTGSHDTGSHDTRSHDTGSHDGVPGGTARSERWDCDGSAELDLSVERGRLELTLTEDATSVEVEVRAEPMPTGGRNQGLTGLLSWLSDAGGQNTIRVGNRNFPFGDMKIGDMKIGDMRLGDLGLGDLGFADRGFGNVSGSDLGAAGLDPDELRERALEATEISWSQGSRRLVVRSPGENPLRLVPLVVTVRAPAGSRLTLRTGAGDIKVRGRAGDTAARTGSGDVRLDAVDGDIEVTTGSGQVDAGEVSGRTRAKTGSGDLSLAGLRGPAEVRAGSGTVRLGGVRGDLIARAGSGDVTIADVEAGRLDLTTGSGDLRVGVHAGVTAELDISSGSGRVRSDLDVADRAPQTSPAVVVRGRTGSGDVLVTRATATVG